jgi:uncharacterized repeat protein (TIGR01451 family)
MIARGPSAKRALVFLTGLLAAAAVAFPGPGLAQPVWTRSRQYQSPEPPLADGPVPLATTPGAGFTRPVEHPETPVVGINVGYPLSVNPGRDLEYRIVVENRSRSDAFHVKVRVPVPTNSTYKSALPPPTARPTSGEIVWDLETLKGGARRELTLVVEPTTGDEVACCARVSFEHGECVRTKIAKPALRIRTTGPERAKQYEVLAYTIEVTNGGASEARDVVLSEELPPGLDYSESIPSVSGDKNPLVWQLGTLAPGATRRIVLKVIPMQMGSLLLKASVTAAGGIKAIEGNLSRVLVGDARLSLIMTGPVQRSLDLPATYLLTVSNTGATPATNVELRDLLFPRDNVRSRMEFVGASDDGKLVGNDVRWVLGTLTPGSRRTVSMQVRLVEADRRPGEFENLAKVSAEGGLSDSATAKTRFVPAVGMALDIEKQSDPIAVNKTTSFSFRLRQRDAVAWSKVALAVTLPEELQYVGSRGTTGVPATGVPAEGRTVTFAPINELAPGAEASYEITVRALRVADVKVRATITADPGPTARKLEQEESLKILPEVAGAPPTLAPDRSPPEGKPAK